MADDQQSMQNQLSQRVEKEVRQLLGELQMQALVLRQMLEMAQGQGQQPQQPGQPQPGQPQPQPMPPGQPVPPQPDTPHPAARPNGGSRPLREV